tara:strand:+ start:551 stop:898 length:348 start_codon:yes stop_codon:yes gene_type:complete
MKIKCPHCDKMIEKTGSESKQKNPTDEELIEFDIFRDAWQGKKRGLLTEMDNFIKKHKDWREILPTLNQLYLDYDDQRYIPHFQTFINQRKWEMFGTKPKMSKPYGEELDWRRSV